MERYGVIYLIRNDVTKQIYFGQTIQKMNRRYSSGIENTHNEHLRRSIKKYGKENFTFIEEFDVAYSRKELDELEDMYITIYDTMNPECGYNKRGGGGNGKHSEEAIRKQSEAKRGKKNPMYGVSLRGNKSGMYGKGYLVRGEKNSQYGKPRSEEYRKKLSEALKGKNSGEKSPLYGRYGKTHPSAKAVIQLDLEGNFIARHDTVSGAGESIGKHYENIGRCCNRKAKTAYGFKWMYVKDCEVSLSYAD